MQNSSEYNSLKERIEKLIEHFDFEQDATGPNDYQQDQLRALRLLSHAECEAYFEARAKSIIQEAKLEWRENKTANYTLASLFINSDRIEKKETVDTKANKIMSDYEELIQGNHGLKEENLKKMFSPLGFDIDEVDTIFIGNLNTFGKNRGETAHTSYQTQQALDKNSEIALITQILEGIKEFDILINTYIH